MIGFLKDFMQAKAVDRSPAYAAKMKAMYEADLANQQSQMRADWMNQNRDTILGRQGVPAQLGLPSDNPALQGSPAQPGTGAYAPGVDPMQRHLMERNFSMGAAPLAGIQSQGFQNMNSMQGNIMSGINNLATERWKQSNPTAGYKERDVPIEGGKWRKEVSQDNGRTWQPMAGANPYEKSSGVDITVGDQLRSMPEQIKLDDQLKWAEGARDYVSGVVATSRDAYDRIATVDRMIDLLDKVETGKGQQALLEAKKLARTLGLDVETADEEALMNMLGDEVMARVAQTKGSVSEKEMELFQRYSANYGNSPAGNKAILRWSKAKAQRDVQLGKIARDMQKQGKSSLEIQDALDAHIAENDISSFLVAPGGSAREQADAILRELEG